MPLDRSFGTSALIPVSRRSKGCPLVRLIFFCLISLDPSRYFRLSLFYTTSPFSSWPGALQYKRPCTYIEIQASPFPHSTTTLRELYSVASTSTSTLPRFGRFHFAFSFVISPSASLVSSQLAHRPQFALDCTTIHVILTRLLVSGYIVPLLQQNHSRLLWLASTALDSRLSTLVSLQLSESARASSVLSHTPRHRHLLVLGSALI